MQQKWLIYGSYGYTGKLIAQAAKERGLTPILAGRDRQKLAEQAQILRFEYRAFGLTSPEQIASNLEGVALVLHCAGPFAYTAEQMIEACMRVRAHYLDISGELGAFETVYARHSALQKLGIMAVPGVGFDVVPTEYVGAVLKAKLPSALEIKVALKTQGSVSPGTAKTMVDALTRPGSKRVDGKLVSTVLGGETWTTEFNGKPRGTILIPGAELAAIFMSTGVENISIYISMSSSAVKWIKRLSMTTGWLGSGPFAKKAHQMILKGVGRVIPGPGADARAKGKNLIRGEARAASGEIAEVLVETTDGYDFTVEAALAAVQRITGGDAKPGAWAPSQAFGIEFAQSVPGFRDLT